MSTILEYALRKSCEVTTWIGALGYLGLDLSGELKSSIAQAVVAIMTAVLIAVNERKVAVK